MPSYSPVVDIEKTREPGLKWYRGFFSIGFIATAIVKLWEARYSFPPKFHLIPQKPYWLSASLHLLGYTVHLTRFLEGSRTL